MLLRLLKYNTTAGYLLIPLLAVLAWWPSFISGSYQQMAFDFFPMPLYELISDRIPHHSLISKIIALILLLFSGFYLIRLNNKYLFLSERTLLPAFIFVLIASSISPLQRLHPALVAMLFLLPAIDRLLASYKNERLSYSFFEASFLIGTGSLVYFNLIFFAVIVWVALLILRPVIWREWVFSILGVVIPWIFFLATLYFIHDSFLPGLELLGTQFTAGNVFNFMHLPEYIFFGYLFFLILIASSKVSRSMYTMKVLSRKIFMLFFWVYALGVVIYFIVETAGIELVVPSTVPVAFLLTHFILSRKRGFCNNGILWSIITGTLILSWLPVIIS